MRIRISLCDTDPLFGDPAPLRALADAPRLLHGEGTAWTASETARQRQAGTFIPHMRTRTSPDDRHHTKDLS